jgi:hypothetical protein
MNLRNIRRRLSALFGLLSILVLTAVTTFGHCDTMDGPVVRAAQAALKTGNVNLVVIWVKEKDEAEVREAFRKTLKVRRLSRAARELADRYFFETVVRIHRTSEGAPYTGLKPAGTDLGPVIPVADRALENGLLAPLLKLFPDSVRSDIEKRFSDAVAKKNFNRNDVTAGRQYVEAYSSFLEYLERLYEQHHGNSS